LFSQIDPDPRRYYSGNNEDEDFIENFLRWDQKNTYVENGILFLGSSSIRKWPTSNYFDYLPIINRGFGGSHISDVNYYFKSIASIYKPRTIVLYAGDNDIAGKKTPEQVLEDYIDFIILVREHLPQTKIIYLPIKPSPSRWSMWNDMRQANRLIKMYTDSDNMQYYADTATPMLDSQGKPLGDLFVGDSLHLSKKGYDLWSEILKPILDSLTMIDRIKIFGW
tara:strand:- start:997 stop:1665 length:669 start_codon:yes stop_codon:yes gene_type:complete